MFIVLSFCCYAIILCFVLWGRLASSWGGGGPGRQMYPSQFGVFGLRALGCLVFHVFRVRILWWARGGASLLATFRRAPRGDTPRPRVKEALRRAASPANGRRCRKRGALWRAQGFRGRQLTARVAPPDGTSPPHRRFTRKLRFGCSGIWCFRMWCFKKIVLNSSPISALEVKSPYLQFLRVNHTLFQTPHLQTPHP